MEIEHSLEVRIRGAISRALETEGFNRDEAYDLSKRAAQLLTESSADAAAPSSPAHSLTRAALPEDSSARAALPDDLGRRIDSQTAQIAGRLDSLGTFLGIATVAMLLSSVLLAAVLHEAFGRLAVE